MKKNTKLTIIQIVTFIVIILGMMHLPSPLVAVHSGALGILSIAGLQFVKVVHAIDEEYYNDM